MAKRQRYRTNEKNPQGYKVVKKDPNLIAKTDSLLTANRHVPFIDRIINAEKYPGRMNPDGTVSSHLMRHDVDEQGNWYAYPGLKYSGGQYHEFTNPKEAFADAIKTGNFINFGKDSNFAEAFSKGEKTWKAWLKMKQNKK